MKKIYYNIETKKFAGADHIGKQYKSIKNKIKFIEIKKIDWINFMKKNSSKQIKVINGKLVAEERKISLEHLKNIEIKKRKNYRKEAFENWFDDLENMPQEIKEKSLKAKREIKEIEKITKKEDLIKYEVKNG